jgi:hypothetical protein
MVQVELRLKVLMPLFPTTYWEGHRPFELAAGNGVADGGNLRAPDRDAG